MLMNDIGYSSPNSPFWVSTNVRELSKARVYRIKSFSKSGLLKEGVWDIVIFMSLKWPFKYYSTWTIQFSSPFAAKVSEFVRN